MITWMADHLLIKNVVLKQWLEKIRVLIFVGCIKFLFLKAWARTSQTSSNNDKNFSSAERPTLPTACCQRKLKTGSLEPPNIYKAIIPSPTEAVLNSIWETKILKVYVPYLTNAA